MTKKEAIEFLRESKVYVNGKSKEIQEKLFSLGYGWSTNGKQVIYTDKPFLFIQENSKITCGSDMEYFKSHEYREITSEELLSIQITERYRPFESQKECLDEMLKHEPFGWVKYKKDNCMVAITEITPNNSIKIYTHKAFVYALQDIEFLDGTPFGIKEE